MERAAFTYFIPGPMKRADSLLRHKSRRREMPKHNVYVMVACVVQILPNKSEVCKWYKFLRNLTLSSTYFFTVLLIAIFILGFSILSSTSRIERLAASTHDSASNNARSSISRREV